MLLCWLMMCLQIISRMQKNKNVFVDASLLLNNDWHSIATPAVWVPFEEQKKSVAEWLTDAIEGKMSDYGVELIDKKYDYSKTRK